MQFLRSYHGAPLEMSQNGSEHSQDENQEVNMDETVIVPNIQVQARNSWELLRPQLRDQLKGTKNVLWSEAARVRYHARKEPPLYVPIQSTARMANLGSLSNIPKPDSEINKRVCVVFGDLLQMKTDAVAIPLDDGELAQRAKALAGPEMADLLRRQLEQQTEIVITPSFALQVEGLPQSILHVRVPVAEDPNALKQAYEGVFRNIANEAIATIALPVFSAQAYPIPGNPGYPVVGAIHVLLSSLRQYFEKPKNFESNLIVIVCANERERRIVNELMELYFPHDPDNEIPDELVEPEPPVVEAPKSKKGKRGKSGKK